MKFIPLTRGLHAIVDDEDYDYLMQWKWCVSGYEPYWHAVRSLPRINKKTKAMKMHRQLMNVESNYFIDHINHNTLDNRKCNLRICLKNENERNRKLQKNNSSGYKGVWYDKRDNKWRVSIQINKKRYHIGGFDDLIDAAKAYDEAAKIYHGKFAKLNFGND